MAHPCTIDNTHTHTHVNAETERRETHLRRKAQGKYLSAGIMGVLLAVQVDLVAYSRKRPSPRTIYRRSIKFTVEIFFQTPSNFPFCLDPTFLSIVVKEELLESFSVCLLVENRISDDIFFSFISFSDF